MGAPVKDPLIWVAVMFIAGLLAVGVLVDTMLGESPPVEDLDCGDAPPWYADHDCVRGTR